MNPLSLNFAYKFVAFVLMLGEINSFYRRTGLEPEAAYTIPMIREGSHVGPAMAPEISGSVLTDRYFFGFGRGHLANFYERPFKTRSGKNVQGWNKELAGLSSQMGTNGAYELATNWLRASGVSLPALQANYRLNMFQWRYYPDGPDAPAVPLPVYQVEWRGQILRSVTRESAVVSVIVFGATKQVVEHHILDDALFSNPPVRITNRESLLAVVDAEFQLLNDAQKSELIAKFGFTNSPQKPLMPLDGTGSKKELRSP